MAAPAASASPPSSFWRRVGHDVFTTAGSDEKCQACVALGAKRAINYRTEDFVAVIKAETGGKGVDVILDMVGGDYIQRNMAAAALWGRIVNIAYQKGAKAEVNFAPLLRKRLALMATTLRGRTVARERRHPRRPGAARSGRWWRRAGSSRWWTAACPWARPKKPMKSWPVPAISAKSCCCRAEIGPKSLCFRGHGG